MGLKLRINTKKNNNNNNIGRSSLELDEEELEPVSPTTEYLFSETVSLSVLCIFELEIPVHLPSIIPFLDVFAERLPRFSSIPIEDMKGRKMWKRVSMNVEDHIKVASFPEELSTKNYSEHFDHYVSKIATSQFPPNKPLWELHIVNCPKGHTSAGVLIFKIHHAIGDGASLMGIVFSGFKRVDDPSLPITIPSKSQTSLKNEVGVANNMINVIKMVPTFISSVIYSLHDFGQAIMMLLFEDTKTPIRSGSVDMTRPFSTRVCSLDLPLNDVKRIKTLLGVTVNDVIIGIIFYATQLYIQETHHKEPVKNARLTASILVNIRSGKQRATKLEELREEKAWGNRVSLMTLALPKFEDEDLKNNPLKFIKNAHKIVKAKRSGVYSPFLKEGFLSVIKAIGGLETAARILNRIWTNCSFGITNIIGPREQVSIGNHPINGFYFVPTGVNLSLVVSVMSYMETLRIGLVVEDGFIDHKKLTTCVENAFQLIFEATLASSKSTI